MDVEFNCELGHEYCFIGEVIMKWKYPCLFPLFSWEQLGSVSIIIRTPHSINCSTRSRSEDI